MVAIRKQKNKAYILLESLVALATLVTICSLILSAVDAGRRRQAWELEQQEVLNLAQMAVQTKQDDLALNGVAVQVQRTEDKIVVFHEGKEVLSVVKK
ncbi:TPA: Type II secretory pathway, pseudopilin PulG [Streptococcus suis]|uniref:Type II secretory pathway, pseudopilin PulG n=1 Tax=Streptococcus suis TaxID=1307 RepID=A0A7T1LAC9_STRSU|nr:competence type IV pilus minor pilin ComGE [Streptococcus suis]MCQ8272444.1 Type II secretory pathway, pseudopilin PulG [Streptococcus suis]MDW8720996.1 competence type IV pilus minor pilin ComGE [Streptococcus suis]MDY7599465.1 competence type IV pilus minor pilin ComGE [Streptococcus suis]MEE3745899.1 competence type IV pilus minor pilin ComGE [Streptococcus suis]NQH42264.1 Type II secretory pathway, pseudopilin PulG [Streptococcus suis]